jgi:hypothetical protein
MIASLPEAFAFALAFARAQQAADAEGDGQPAHRAANQPRGFAWGFLTIRPPW